MACTRRSTARHSWRQRETCRFAARVPSCRTGTSSVEVEHLSRHGWAIVKLPPRVVRLGQRVRECMLPFFSGTIAEKDRFRTRQQGEKVLSHPGYLTPSPGWAELFEVRRSCKDHSYRFPPGCEGPLYELFDALRELALHWLSVISFHLCGDAGALHSLVATDTGPSVMRVIHYDQVPALAQQLTELPTELREQGERRLIAGFPTHTDGSMLTIAPRASCSGLAIRDYATCQWKYVERNMAEDEAVVFCGDPLSFVARHHFPAAMHRPDGKEMARQSPQQRLSMPFFLYPDSDAVLDSNITKHTLRAADGHSALTALPSPQLSVADLKLNVGGCRMNWPWKKERYYSGLVLADDANPFPGEMDSYQKREGY